MPTPATGIYLVPRDLKPLAEAVRATDYVKAGELVGCSKGYIHSLLSGLRPQVTVDTATRIEDRLGQPRGSMFTLSAADSARLAPYGAEMCRLAS